MGPRSNSSLASEGLGRAGLAASESAALRVQIASLVTLTTTPSGAPNWNRPSQWTLMPARISGSRSSSKAVWVTIASRGLTCLVR